MKPEFTWTDSAREFCKLWNLQGGANLAMELIGKHFVTPEDCTVTHESDPESGGDPNSETLLFSFGVRTDVPTMLRRYNACVQEWVRLAHDFEMMKITLAYWFKD